MYKALQRILAVSAALLVIAPSAPALAEAPMIKTQVPGYYRTMLGQFEVTALYDGAIELDTKLLKNANPEDLNRMLARMFVGNPKMQTAVNAYLINTGTNLVLVDAGAAKLFGPGLGYVIDNMKAAGYDPAQVDTVIVTHLHPDHIGGLGDPTSPPVFPNATVFVSLTDHDFWMSPQAAAAATPEMQGFFKIARETAAPYQARGKWRTFAEGTELVTGLRAVKAYGHTPGHTAFSVESAGQKLLIWGDLVHAHAVQFAQPGVSIEFDFDQTQAIATRRSIMYSMAASKTLVAGMHLPFPGIGHVRADGKGIYSWVPVEYSPIPK
ncbi:MBL fold metallo-hydrolase [Aromatoleum diolicum]|uniref:MBL fold metallo-hydrolase n=1 Tax=Aromatoleum diolicum TaxID=75796 RepID=A0ABX1Q9Q3_9RHOO|nr:MBL fold metallo-hydrolase [Aromatoleum diolicum]NMG75113.1 MBL fold metallo-hydrolase [Aromatoleum diolicum]